MIRKIVKISAEKCNGCGLCVQACHESAIGLVDGVAKLLRDDYCDGLGDCLPVCPTGAITFEEREAASYDEAAVQANILLKNAASPLQNGCPVCTAYTVMSTGAGPTPAVTSTDEIGSQLRQWPVQIRLVPVQAAIYDQAHLLVAADCSAYAYGNFHNKFMADKITIIGCPKLDGIDYSEKLTELLKNNNFASLTLTRVEVPCCGGLEMAVKAALTNSGKPIPLQVIILTTDGGIRDGM